MDCVYREASTRHRESGLPPLGLSHRLPIWTWWWGLALAALLVAAALLVCALAFGIVTIDRIAGTEDAANAVVGFIAASGAAVALVPSTRSSSSWVAPRRERAAPLR
jgi:hypothetical protein